MLHPVFLAGLGEQETQELNRSTRLQPEGLKLEEETEEVGYATPIDALVASILGRNA